MIVDRTHTRWVFVTTAIALGSTAAYLIYAGLASNGPRGGTWMGLIYGFAGTFVIIFECLLSARKKYPASPLGRVSTWLRAHVWLGLLSFLLILFHAGFRWGEGLASVLMWMFALISASGVFGVILQNYLPRRMTELVKRETVYEMIPGLVRQLRAEADERIEFLTADLGIPAEEEEEVVRAGGVKRYYDAGQKKSAAEKVAAEVNKRKVSPQIAVDGTSRQVLRDHYLQEIRPFLSESPATFQRKLFRTEELVAAYFTHLRTVTQAAAHVVLDDLEQICEERRQLMIEQRLYRWLHGWLYAHIPISFAFLALILVHAVISLRY
jgi:hypothetical protein